MPLILILCQTQCGIILFFFLNGGDKHSDCHFSIFLISCFLDINCTRTPYLIGKSFHRFSINLEDDVSLPEWATFFRQLAGEQSPNTHYTSFPRINVTDEEAKAQTTQFLLYSHLQSVL